MKKLIRGIVQFQRDIRPDYRETFARLALGQAPDALLIACSDSRVVPNLFASADPGDLFVVRNVGNLVPPASSSSHPSSDGSEAAALEFALVKLQVPDIIVCGHSECGAMQALLQGRDAIEAVYVRSWLLHGEVSLAELDKHPGPDPTLARHNQLSQLNVLAQLEHLKSYPIVQERIAAGRLRLHGWWFELSKADVYAYEQEQGRFVVIDPMHAERLLRTLEP
jgi:carbonic anhydrase